ncbi:MAG TPA: LamG domain-containing protein [Candidatus Bathyarchaeia archaeon]|nr:LamG domain-containing protein [Candidatus Bathyarchaeia archaeon]
MHKKWEFLIFLSFLTLFVILLWKMVPRPRNESEKDEIDINGYQFSDRLISPSPFQPVFDETKPEPSPTPGSRLRIISESAQAGEGITHLARRALNEYLKQRSYESELISDQGKCIENDLQKKIGSKLLEVSEIIEFPIYLIEQALYSCLYRDNSMFRAGSGLKFDGVNDFVSVSNFSSLNIGEGDFSVEAWIKATEGSANVDRFVVSKGEIGYTGYNLGLENGGYIFFRVNNFYVGSQGTMNDYADWVVTPAQEVDDGLWHHLTGVQEGNYLRIYLDGDQIAYKKIWKTIGKDTSYNMAIGSQSDQPTRFFMGSIDEIRIWEIALDQSQIRENMFRQINPDQTVGLIGYWRLDEGSGQKFYDTSSNGNNGILGNDNLLGDDDPSWVTGFLTR